MAHGIIDAVWETVRAYKSITVGTEEHNADYSKFQNQFGSTAATVVASDCYIETCETYDVLVAREFEEEKESSVCLDVSAFLLRDVSRSYVHCKDWPKQRDLFIWYIEVKPAW